MMFTTVVMVAAVIGGTVVVSVCIIVCAVAYLQKAKNRHRESLLRVQQEQPQPIYLAHPRQQQLQQQQHQQLQHPLSLPPPQHAQHTMQRPQPTQAQYRPVPAQTDEYLAPTQLVETQRRPVQQAQNVNSSNTIRPAEAIPSQPSEEPLIHIWEQPLPDPLAD